MNTYPAQRAGNVNDTNMSQTIRAKMQVQSVKATTYSDIAEFSCVYGGSTNAEDNTFASATPSGGMNLQIDNPAVRGTITPGRKCYVDITFIDE